MAWEKYRCDFYSENKLAGPSGSGVADNLDPKQQLWRISIFKETGTQPAGYPKDFKCNSEGFKLKMDGEDDNVFESPIKTTSVEFSVIEEGNDQKEIITDILSVATGNENEFSVVIYRNTTDGSTATLESYWRGVLQGDLVDVQDVGINNIIKVRATDGINQLKYRNYDLTQHGGVRSAMYIVKACLRQIALTSNQYSTTDYFVAHTPYYYSQAMGSSSGDIFNSNWRESTNRDPLGLTHINTEVFKDEDNQSMSYYHVLEQILACFQLRLMMTQVNDENYDRSAMWYLNSPFIYEENPYGVLMMFHGNDLTTNSAINYMDNFNIRIVDPQARTTGSLTSYDPPLYSYKTIYEHKVLQNLCLGPLTWNSWEWWDDDFSATTDKYIGTTPNEFHITLTEDSEADDYGIGLPDNYHPAHQRFLITGNVKYVPNKRLAWNFFKEQNYYVSFFTGYDYVAWVNQHISLSLGLWFSTYSEIPEEQAWPFFRYVWLGSSSHMVNIGGPQWLGPNDGASGSPGMAFWDITPPAVFNYEDSLGNVIYPWGSNNDTATVGTGMFYITTPSINPEQSYAFFTPLYHSVNSYLLSTSTSSSTSFYSTYNLMDIQDEWSTDWNAFSIESPAIPVYYAQGDAGGWVGPAAGQASVRGIRLYYALHRFAWTDDSGDSHYTCSLDWGNMQELNSNDRGVGFDYYLNDVRVYIVGNSSENDGYYDYSVGQYTNQNGTPSESATQDPAVIIGDAPAADIVSDSATLNEGVQLVYFGQFLIKQDNADGTIYADPTTNNQVPQWFTIDESDYGWGPRLHKLRARQMVRFNYKLKQRLQLNFVDRTPDSQYHSDFDLTRFGFTALLHWNNSENSDWVGPHFLVSGGEFTAGDMSWKITAQEVDVFEWDNITDESYGTNNA